MTMANRNNTLNLSIELVMDHIEAERRAAFDREPFHYDDSDEAFLARVAERGVVAAWMVA